MQNRDHMMYVNLCNILTLRGHRDEYQVESTVAGDPAGVNP